jgi:hypothetical protein
LAECRTMTLSRQRQEQTRSDALAGIIGPATLHPIQRGVLVLTQDGGGTWRRRSPSTCSSAPGIIPTSQHLLRLQGPRVLIESTTLVRLPCPQRPARSCGLWLPLSRTGPNWYLSLDRRSLTHRGVRARWVSCSRCHSALRQRQPATLLNCGPQAASPGNTFRVSCLVLCLILN